MEEENNVLFSVLLAFLYGTCLKYKSAYFGPNKTVILLLAYKIYYVAFKKCIAFTMCIY